MEWVNKLAWFFVGLLVLGIVVHVLWPVCIDILRFYRNKTVNYFRLWRVLKEVQDIASGKISPSRMTEHEEQTDGGITIRTFENGMLVQEERFTPWEWKEHKKVLEQLTKELTEENKRPK